MTGHSTLGVLGAGVIGNRRGPETLRELVGELGPTARAGTAGQAAEPDLVFLAVPFFAVPDLTGLTARAGKIVVDTTNQFAVADPWRGRYDVGDLTGSEWVARHLPGARIVKALNTLFAPFIAADPRHAAGRRREENRGRLMQLDGPLSAKHLLPQDVG